MVQQTIEFLDLPDEILLMIFKNLPNIYILYSFEGVNKRLDAIAVSMARTRCICLKEFIDNDGCSILDRVCSQIFPRICDNIGAFSIETSIMERVLLSNKYPNLFYLGITDFCPEKTLNYLSDESLIANLLKEQITTLSLCVNNDTTIKLFTEVCIRLFTVCKKLRYLFFINNIDVQLSLRNFPTNACCSSTLCHLIIDLVTFDDCLYLLDGRLNQLTKFIVEIEDIEESSLIIYNTASLPNLKVFSLICNNYTDVYDTRILPLLRRMFNLTYLTLNLKTNNRVEFIDGIHLENEIVSHMSRLEKFNFHITTKVEISDPEHRQSLDDIQNTFTNWKLDQVKCCVDYFPNHNGKCDIYSVPYHFGYIYDVGHSFHGHLFKNVTRLRVSDQRSFEHDFFYWISIAFPNLKYIAVLNRKPQERKYSNDQHTVHYPKLLHLNVRFAHIDYVNQFLRHEYTRISQPFYINIDYDQLVTVTNNFTNDATRVNCSQIDCHIIYKPFVYPENFYQYFPLL